LASRSPIVGIASYTPGASSEEKKSHLATEAPPRRLPRRARSAGRVGGIAIYGTAPSLNSFKLDIDGGG